LVGRKRAQFVYFRCARQGESNRIALHCDRGFWESYRTIREDRFKFAAEAKKAITERGYYLIGGEINVTEIKNPLDR
jgi:hypothetical protein